MGIMTREDAMRVAATGNKLKDLPMITQIPKGYYLHRDRKRIALLQADQLFIPFYNGRGLEFLGLAKDIDRETAEACVYLRELAVLAPDIVEPTEAPVKTAKRKRKKKRLKKGGKT